MWVVFICTSIPNIHTSKSPGVTLNFDNINITEFFNYKSF